jgi:hypothetical protein
MSRLRVYVSGPLSQGDRHANVRRAIDVGLALIEHGFSPLIPHLTDYMDPSETKFSHGIWLEVDLAWVKVADAVLRLSGPSVGADMECNLAQKLGIPVYPNLDALVANPPILGNTRYQELLGEMSRLHAHKARDYGTDHDSLANVRASREWGLADYLGVFIRMGDKIQRIKTWSQKGTLANESIYDSLKDLAAYALIAHVLIEEGADPAKGQN